MYLVARLSQMPKARRKMVGTNLRRLKLQHQQHLLKKMKMMRKLRLSSSSYLRNKLANWLMAP